MYVSTGHREDIVATDKHEKYTQREYALMFTFNVGEYVREHNATCLPGDKLPTDTEWILRWESAYHLEHHRAVARLRNVYKQVNGHEMPTGHCNDKTLAGIQNAIQAELEHAITLEYLETETAERQALIAAAEAEAAERARIERVLLGIEQPRKGDSLPDWAEHELIAEKNGWGGNTRPIQKRKKKNGLKDS